MALWLEGSLAEGLDTEGPDSEGLQSEGPSDWRAISLDTIEVYILLFSKMSEIGIFFSNQEYYSYSVRLQQDIISKFRINSFARFFIMQHS